MLKDFKGVLISDFFPAYDGLSCPQQKCLIHIMRDLNDDLMKNPFDEEFKTVAGQFGALLRCIIGTVDQFGLKKRHLHKHERDVERFFKVFIDKEYQSETAQKYVKRFQKNKDKLFTFLKYDGVPWNNNNAENAIKSFARLRSDTQGLLTANSIRPHLVLLSICQTCKFKGVSFLEFLLSEEKDVEVFASSKRARRVTFDHKFG